MSMSKSIVAFASKCRRKIAYEATRHSQTVRESSTKLQAQAERPETSQLRIASAIQAGQPYLQSRFGLTELECLTDVLVERSVHLSAPVRKYLEFFRVFPDVTAFNRKRAWQLSGIFPDTPELYRRFGGAYLDAAESIDTLVPFNMAWEQTARRACCPQSDLLHPRALEPFFFSDPWTAALEGKRVLVINPFVKLIEQQYARRKEIWQDPRMLPKFELVTVQAVQTLGFETAGYADWFAAFDDMRRQVDGVGDFDVALIGAGAYGLPLGAHVKSLGRVALHVGGILQFYFGVSGERWSESLHHEYGRFVNASWVRPDRAVRPPGLDGSGDGRYW